MIFQIQFALHLEQDGFDIDHFCRLGDVVHGAQPDGLDGGIHAGMTGHHHRLGVGSYGFEMFEHLHSGHSGHPQIQHGGVEGLFFKRLYGGLAIGTRGYLVA